MTSPRLALYVTPYCGYCRYVMSAIQQLGLAVELRNVAADQQDFEDLFKARGRTTVPVLRISTADGEQWMPESQDIVEYLQALRDQLDTMA